MDEDAYQAYRSVIVSLEPSIDLGGGVRRATLARF